MVGAEKELTENLKHTHQQIDDQLNMLRENLQVKREEDDIGGILVKEYGYPNRSALTLSYPITSVSVP